MTTKTSITLNAHNPEHPPWQVPVAYIAGNVAVHRQPLDALGRLSKTSWRLTHLPSGAKIWDCRSYRTIRAVAKAIGNDPLFGDALCVDAPKATLELAWTRLQQVIDECKSLGAEP